MLLIPLLYWCVDAVLGMRIILMLIPSTSLADTLKFFFHGPRPFWYSAQVQAHSVETSFGFPSGHSLNAASLWGLVAWHAKKRPLTLLMLLGIVLIGLSRIYLGVHFVHDVLVGWLLGGLLLLVFVRLEQPVLQFYRRLPEAGQYLAALLSSLLIIAIYALAKNSLGDWSLPAAWLSNAQPALQGEPLSPVHFENAFTNAGTWFGMVAGMTWYTNRYGLLNVQGAWQQRALRYLLGVVGIFVIWYGLGALQPRTADLGAYSVRFVRYTLVGLWSTALAPYLFLRFGLSAPSPASTSA